MTKCFIIQPFDAGKFDKRYEDVFAPAVKAAGLEPYRVDRDPGVSIPIEDIQSKIEGSAACLVDISTDNPNVWFELGYAIAARREVILICSDERTSKFPFDVQHRSIIKYSTESPRDFRELGTKIESRIKAIMQRREKLGQVTQMQSVARVEGLEQHSIAALISVAEQIDAPTDGVSVYRVRSVMENAGFTKIATTLALKALRDNGMVESFEDQDYDGGIFVACRITDNGMTWLLENQDKLVLRQDPPAASAGEDLPF